MSLRLLQRYHALPILSHPTGVPRARSSFVPHTPFHLAGSSTASGSRLFYLAACLFNESALSSYKATFGFPAPTTKVEDLSVHHVGEQVVLYGYFGVRSDVTKSISFAPLLCPSLGHSVQLISSPKGQKEDDHVHAYFKSFEPNVPVAIRGVVQQKVKPKDPRREHEVKRNEDVEVRVSELILLNRFFERIEFQEETKLPSEQRHLQIRQSKALRDALAFRSKATQACRNHLIDRHAFVEIETPLLFKSTPEGAREFLVPTRNKGHAYALPQSPQQYKQILMASGIPRYFQIAKCFRDEDLRADRQPEFTQLDLEMSFVTSQDVMMCIEGLIKILWTDLLGTDLEADPFPTMTYEDAMSRYGSDKPDTRLGMEISRIGHLIPVDLISKIGPLTDPIVEVIKLSPSEDPKETRNFISNFMDSPSAHPFVKNPDGQPGIFVYDSRKPLGGLQPFGFEAAEHLEERLELEEGDVVVLQARKNAPFTGGSIPLGNMRLALHRHAVENGWIAAPKGWNFLWVNEFPLFSLENGVDPGQGGSAGLFSTHHPFTAPASTQDVDLMSSEPLKAKADHYDLVLNGVELGGGSRRIHHADIQEYVLKDILKMTKERLQDFTHLLDVLRAGCPPHTGIALGFDRLCAVMLGKESIRDVVAFPKTGRGEDPLVKSPSKITKAQLNTYHLQLKA